MATLNTAQRTTLSLLLRSLSGDVVAIDTLFGVSGSIAERTSQQNLLRALAGHRSGVDDLFGLTPDGSPNFSTAERASARTLLEALSGDPAALDALSFGGSSAISAAIAASVMSPTAQLAALISGFSYPGLVATRSALGTHLAAVTTPFMSRKFFYARDNITAVQVGFPNYAIVNPSGEVASGGVLTVKASIEYPAGTFTQLTFSGSATGTVASGGVLWSDLVTLTTPIPAGAVAWWRSLQSNTVAMPVTTATGATPGPYQYVAGGDATVSNGTDQTMSGTVVDDGSGTVVWHGPIVALTGQPSFALFGDSRSVGFGDTADASGDCGELARSIGPSYAYMYLGCPGERASQLVTQSAKRMFLAQFASHVMAQHGINDLNAGNAAATVISNLQTIRNKIPNKPFYGATVAPKTTSTDAWTTVANQTTDSTDAARETFNTSMLAIPSGYTDVKDLSSFQVAPGVPSKWNAPGKTADGLHATQSGYKDVSFSFPGLSASTPWSPLSSTPSLWLRGDLGVVTSSGLVTSWTDQSLNGIVCTSSGSLRPTTSTNINGKQCISFGGTQAILVPSFALSGAKTLVFVVKLSSLPASGSSCEPISLKDSGSAVFTRMSFVNTVTGYTPLSIDDASGSPYVGFGATHSAPDTAVHDYVVLYNGSGQAIGNWTFKDNGTTQTTVASGVTGGFTSTDQGALGGRVNASSAISAGMIGDIGEIIIFPRILTTLEQNALRSYLLNQWGA